MTRQPQTQASGLYELVLDGWPSLKIPPYELNLDGWPFELVTEPSELKAEPCELVLPDTSCGAAPNETPQHRRQRPQRRRK
jgi:hypothetical protein